MKSPVIIAMREFIFNDVSEFTKLCFRSGSVSPIETWMDTHIIKSAFIQIDLLEMYSDDQGKVHLWYQVIKREKINNEYSYRHLALQERKLN